MANDYIVYQKYNVMKPKKNKVEINNISPLRCSRINFSAELYNEGGKVFDKDFDTIINNNSLKFFHLDIVHNIRKETKDESIPFLIRLSGNGKIKIGIKNSGSTWFYVDAFPQGFSLTQRPGENMVILTAKFICRKQTEVSQ